jgi:hypothetical protein
MITPFILGCNPTFDWRILQSKDNNWQAYFPGKPLERNRDLKLEIDNVSVKLKMVQHSAKVNEMVFTLDSSKVLNNKIKLARLSEKLETTLKKNFKLNNKRDLGKNIYVYSGMLPSSKKPSIEIKLMTSSFSKEKSILRGVVYGEADKFIKNEAMFFLESIK